MTEFIDIFGTDDLFADDSNASSLLGDVRDYLRDTVEPDVTGSTSSDDWEFIVQDGSSDHVDISVCECTSYCSGYDLDDRRGASEEWLQNNYVAYDSASVCVVMDHHDECTGSGEPLGVSKLDGWNTNGKKTLIVNTALSLDGDPATNWGQIVAHEIGHTLGALHSDTAVYYNSNLAYYSATHMWTPPVDGTSTDCNNGDSTDTLDNTFSNCALNEIDQTL